MDFNRGFRVQKGSLLSEPDPDPLIRLFVLLDLRRGRIEIHPPKQIGKGEYTILVPKVDADGNDIAGIRLPAIAAPIGTYTGWNLQPSDLAEDELSGLLGSFIPFAKNKAERSKNGDPRLSIEERYQNRKHYVQQISRAARALMDQRLLLAEDAERIIEEAARREILSADPYSDLRMPKQRTTQILRH